MYNYIGDLGFNLSNAGELIRLYNSEGSIVDSLTYYDVDPWPVEPDGTGCSLALRDSDSDNSIPENWTYSNNYGTPGAVNDWMSGVDDIEVPTMFSLGQNYPNPFNPRTTIEFTLPAAGFTNLLIYNVMGQKVRELVSDTMKAGVHAVIWDGKDDSGNPVSSGIYLINLKSGEHTSTGRMLMMK